MILLIDASVYQSTIVSANTFSVMDRTVYSGKQPSNGVWYTFLEGCTDAPDLGIVSHTTEKGDTHRWLPPFLRSIHPLI